MCIEEKNNALDLNFLASVETHSHNTPRFYAKVDFADEFAHIEKNFLDALVGEVWALVIFHSDGLFILKNLNIPNFSNSSEKNARRFFQIAHRLPIELQMVLCNRIANITKKIILSKDSEPAFQKLAHLFVYT